MSSVCPGAAVVNNPAFLILPRSLIAWSPPFMCPLITAHILGDCASPFKMIANAIFQGSNAGAGIARELPHRATGHQVDRKSGWMQLQSRIGWKWLQGLLATDSNCWNRWWLLNSMYSRLPILHHSSNHETRVIECINTRRCNWFYFVVYYSLYAFLIASCSLFKYASKVLRGTL